MKVSLRPGIHYFDVVIVLIAIACAIASLLTATGQIWPKHLWNYKDWLGLGLVSTVTTFIVLRSRGYSQKSPWLLLLSCGLAFGAMVVLLRRWNLVWVGVGSAMLLFCLLTRSKTVSEGFSREDGLRALLIVGSLLFSFALIEGALRMFPGLLPEGARLRVHWQGDAKPWNIPHPYIGYLHIPEANASGRTARPGIETAGKRDIWGFRNIWPWPERAEIIAVGDSLTYSQMVEDDQAWTAILDQALPHSRVLNLGLIGAGPQQYLRIYETFGIGMAPKLLLVGLFLGNDLWDAGKFDRWWKSGAKESFFEFGRPEVTPGVWGWLTLGVKKSYLVTILRDLHESYRSGRFLSGRTVHLADGGRVQLVPSELAKWAEYARPEHETFRLVLETLERIQELADQNQTQLLVLFFPMKEEVYLPLLEKDVPDLAAPFIAELDKRGISYLDLGPPFRERAARGEALFWEVDGHPNPRGYALIAEVVLSHLKTNATRYDLKD